MEKYGKIAAVCAAAFLAVFIMAGDGSSSGSLRELIREFNELMGSARQGGSDVYAAIELDAKSRQAAESGDMVLAEKYLRDAIGVLKRGQVGAGGSNSHESLRTVSIPVEFASAVVTKAVPNARDGQGVNDIRSAFPSKVIRADGGRLSLEIGQVPLYVEEAGRVARGDISLPSPFGFHPAHVAKKERGGSDAKLPPPSYFDYSYADAINIGVGWNRPDYYALWDLIQKDNDLESGFFDWKELDYVYSSVHSGIKIMGNIDGLAKRMNRGSGRNPRMYTFKTPELEAKYQVFVKALVERYDGDGLSDMPGLRSPIKYWQVVNEPDAATSDVDGYAHLLEITAKAIKSACQECKVVAGGLALGPVGFNEFFLPVLKRHQGMYVDVFDIHHFGFAGQWFEFKRLIDMVRSGLDKNGYGHTEIWVTETGTYSGAPILKGQGRAMPAQSETEQASSLVKRYIYPLSLGARKVFWAFGLMEGFKHDGDFWDYTGLIYSRTLDHGKKGGTKKLSYYTYKMMTEKLGGSDFSTLTRLEVGDERIYAFRVMKSGSPVYIVWGRP